MKDLQLGSRALIVNGKLLGLTIAEAALVVISTDEEMQELQDAEEIRLVKMNGERWTG